MKKIVVLGGGTGLSILLKGLKLFPLDITAVVAVSDDGSSTGVLREEFNIPAVGDLRNVMVSLSDTPPLVEELLQYRFKTSSDLNNHPMGNLLLTALYDITGNLTDSLEVLSKLFNVKGRVLPFSEQSITLMAKTLDNEIIEGESKITKAFKKIDYVYYKEKDVKVNDKVIYAIKNADLILLGIGSLYTSIIPNLLSGDIRNAIDNSKAKVMYVSNIMTEHGETDGFSVSDCIKVINRYMGEHKIEVVLSNTMEIKDDIKKRYYDLESSTPILIDEDNLKEINVEVLRTDLVKYKGTQVRHDSIKTALSIFTYLTIPE